MLTTRNGNQDSGLVTSNSSTIRYGRVADHPPEMRRSAACTRTPTYCHEVCDTPRAHAQKKD